MVVKIEENFEKTRHVENNDKPETFTLHGRRNVRYHDRVLSNKTKSYNFSFTSN